MPTYPTAQSGRLGPQPTLGLLNNPCNNSQLRGATSPSWKGTTDINNTVQLLPFGQQRTCRLWPATTHLSTACRREAASGRHQVPLYLNAIFDPDWVDFGPDRIAGNGDDNNGPQPPISPFSVPWALPAIGSAGNLWVILQELVFEPGTEAAEPAGVRLRRSATPA